MQTPIFLRLNAHPALYAAACFASGIAVAAQAPWVPFLAWAAVALVCMIIVSVVRLHARGRIVSLYPLTRSVSVGLMALSAGGAAYVASRLIPPDHIAYQTGTPAGLGLVSLRGAVVGSPAQYASGFRFDLAVMTASRGETPAPATGRVRVLVRTDSLGIGDPLADAEAGDVVEVMGRLRRVQPRRNPADFDYRAYLEHRGIYHTLSVARPEHAIVLRKSRAPLHRLVGWTRRYVEDRLQQHVPTEPARALVRALVLGDRHAIDADTLTDFRRTGLAHLLAVSGLHVLLVGLVLYRLLVPLLARLRFRWRAIQTLRTGITLAVLLGYMLLTGASASTVRAVVMAAVFMGADVFQRRTNVLNSLGVAALVLLVIRPGALFDVGFQLSFAAVGAIALLYPTLNRAAPDRWFDSAPTRYVLASALVSVAASLGTAPFLLYHFGEVSLASPVLNLVAIPLTSFLLAASLALLVFFPFAPVLAHAYGAAADGLAHALIFTADLGHYVLAWTVVSGRIPSGWLLLTFAATVGALAGWTRSRARWRFLLAGVLSINVGLWTSILSGTDRPRLDVLFFDVGHGDAALITTPNGKHILIDAGGRDAWRDHGARTILPHLRKAGITSLDAVILTHPHSDHTGGLLSLLREISIHTVVHSGDKSESELDGQNVRVMDSLGVAQRTVRTGDTLVVDPDIHIGVLFPSQKAVDAEDPNHGSIVLRIAYGRTAFLFMGDADARAEQEIASRYAALLPSSVIKVGHHGSSTSSSADFVRHVAADSASALLAVVSVGTNSGYGLPNHDVIERWQAHGAAVHITSEQGALWLRSDGREVEVVRWR